jgi:hypothetical protein
MKEQLRLANPQTMSQNILTEVAGIYPTITLMNVDPFKDMKDETKKKRLDITTLRRLFAPQNAKMGRLNAAS